MNGNSSMYNDFDIEGIDDNQRTNLLQIYISPIEAIQEVHISTSNYDPQQGSALGAVTNVILKSGGNAYHGEVYYFYTGNALRARPTSRADSPTTCPAPTPCNWRASTERFNLELRSEWLHATNTPRFSLPNTQFGSSSLGLVTGVSGGSRIINLAGKVTF